MGSHDEFNTQARLNEAELVLNLVNISNKTNLKHTNEHIP